MALVKPSRIREKLPRRQPTPTHDDLSLFLSPAILRSFSWPVFLLPGFGNRAGAGKVGFAGQAGGKREIPRQWEECGDQIFNGGGTRTIQRKGSDHADFHGERCRECAEAFLRRPVRKARERAHPECASRW